MMRLTRIIALAAFSLSLIIVCAANSQAQRCGRGFARIIVSDAEDKVIPEVTIELVAELPAAQYREQWKLWSDFNTKELSTQVAEEIVKQWGQMERTEDFCGNPLRQVANSTRREITPRREIPLRTTRDLGFCTVEGGIERLYLMKITAPGYATGYYAGDFLGGCKRTHKFV